MGIEGNPAVDAAAQLKKLEKEKEKLMVLSMTKEKAMRAREDELVAKTQKLEAVVKKMKGELIEARTLKKYFLLLDRVTETIKQDNPQALADAYKSVGLSQDRVDQMNDAKDKIKQDISQ